MFYNKTVDLDEAADRLAELDMSTRTYLDIMLVLDNIGVDNNLDQEVSKPKKTDVITTWHGKQVYQLKTKFSEEIFHVVLDGDIFYTTAIRMQIVETEERILVDFCDILWLTEVKK